MIIYNIKGNPYGLKVEICARAAGLNIPIEEVTPNGMCFRLDFVYFSLDVRH